MTRAQVGQVAPNFTLKDVTGRDQSLSDFRGKRNVVLVLNRGFL